MRRKTLLVTILFLVMVLAVSTVTMAGFFDWFTGGSEFKYYSPKKLKQSIEQEKEFLLVDIQPQEDFNNHHIKGAIGTYAYPVKSKQDKAKLDRILTQLKKSDDDIVIVCPRGGGGAERTYQYLSSQGIKEKRLYILENGQAGWPYEQLVVDEKLATISTEKLATQLGTQDLVVVDVRSDAAYNGWKLKDETRGGHIKGAVHFPVSWLELLENEELIDTLKNKGVTSDRKIVIYGYKDSQSKKLGLFLKDELDYKDVAIYKNGIVKWSANNDLPMDKLPNYSKLVSPNWVKDLIDGKDPATYDGRDFVIIDTNYKKFGHYKKGHIPTSIYVDTNEIEGPPLWNIVSDAKLKELFKKTGITKDTLVVVYSEEPMAAGRLISVLMYAGVEDVRMLDGGYQAWERAGYSLEKGVNEWQVGGYQVWKKTGHSLKKEIKEWQTGADFGARIPVHPEYYINVPQAKELLKDPNGRLVAVVSWDEYIGKNNGGYSYFDEKGRIPGSVWGHGGSDAYHSEHFVDPDWTMRSYPEIEKMWADWDINPENESAFFCGTGWRGGLAMFDAYLMGWKNISVFDGGWYEWSRNPENPVEFGDPRKE